MQRQVRQFALAGLVASAVSLTPGAARADQFPTESSIHVTPHGGPLLQNVKVITLFWGQGWDGSSLRDHVNGFFQALFADGRYMANLSQYSYSDGSYQIGNGQFLTTATDSTPLGAQVTDREIQHEIGTQIRAGKLPAPQTDYLYAIFTPPGVTVINSDGGTSVKDFLAYHTAAVGSKGDWAAYMVVPAPDAQMMRVAWGLDKPEDEMTASASHELAEAVTDPLPAQNWQGWLDDDLAQAGFADEIGDIPEGLVESGQFDMGNLFDSFTGADGTRYVVQKVWSEQDGGPVAFAASATLQ